MLDLSTKHLLAPYRQQRGWFIRHHIPVHVRGRPLLLLLVKAVGRGARELGGGDLSQAGEDGVVVLLEAVRDDLGNENT